MGFIFLGRMRVKRPQVGATAAIPSCHLIKICFDTEEVRTQKSEPRSHEEELNKESALS